MDIPINAEVQCADGLCGKSTYVVINPVMQQVTHLVVREKESPNMQRIVPLSEVLVTNPDSIRLRCTKSELATMKVFIDYEYLPGTEPYASYANTQYMMWPYYIPATMRVPIVHMHIPPDELAIRRGAGVQATDGHVGRVDEFLVDPVNGHITHLVLREGHLWGKKDVTIPVSDIDVVNDNMVYLKIDKKSIETLPSVPVRR